VGVGVDGVPHKLATAGAIVYSSALAHRAELLTRDRRFPNLPAVLFVPK
jgi:hypothetical protein